MIDKGFSEIMLILVGWHKNISVQNMQNEFHDFVDTKYKVMKFILYLGSIWTEMFLCHPIDISKSLEPLCQLSQFFHHCKGKPRTYLEMGIIFSRFFLFLKYSPLPSNDCVLFCLFVRLFIFYSPCKHGSFFWC